MYASSIPLLQLLPKCCKYSSDVIISHPPRQLRATEFWAKLDTRRTCPLEARVWSVLIRPIRQCNKRMRGWKNKRKKSDGTSMCVINGREAGEGNTGKHAGFKGEKDGRPGKKLRKSGINMKFVNLGLNDFTRTLLSFSFIRRERQADNILNYIDSDATVLSYNIIMNYNRHLFVHQSFDTFTPPATTSNAARKMVRKRDTAMRGWD